ncbi:DNA-methyltransferase [Nitratidesulfovibrio termitidis]|uniref:DNA-methyltransferase n=1 Tax=Nitratidesulfovibrio termitidis TaxID=42252 RepID=UPI000A0748C6|nr:site-specific DNA-methyltransferase [Nitratidesulfovibrio termitidis]
MQPSKKELLASLPKNQAAHVCEDGLYFVGDSPKILKSKRFEQLRGNVDLILTSPPYPLNTKKSYGNLTGDSYLKWFTSLAPIFSSLLTETGSIVLELGNSWEPNRPIQSLLHLESLLGFARHKKANLRLIQQFICYNPSRLPSPAQWVTVNRIRTVDSFTHVWWLAKSDYPKADNKNVLRPYSQSMLKLLKRGNYNAGKRPSEHNISTSGFLKDQGGAIAHNFFEIDALDETRETRLPNTFSMANTSSNDYFHKACKEKNISPHPARMPIGLAGFFIEFLTEKGDLVLDPFAGSNTTGFAAATHDRYWIAVDAEEKYVEQSQIRFTAPEFTNRQVSE